MPSIRSSNSARSLSLSFAPSHKYPFPLPSLSPPLSPNTDRLPQTSSHRSNTHTPLSTFRNPTESSRIDLTLALALTPHVSHSAQRSTPKPNQTKPNHLTSPHLTSPSPPHLNNNNVSLHAHHHHRRTNRNPRASPGQPRFASLSTNSPRAPN